MVQDIAVQLLADIAKIISTMVLTAGGLYTGIGVLDRFTSGIEEWEEIKKGNVAVGIFYATVVLAIMLLIGPRVQDFMALVQPDLALPLLAIAFANYLLGLGIAIAVIYLAIHMLNHLTADLDETAALKKGNIAVAMIMSVVVFAVATATSLAVEAFFVVLKSAELSLI